MASPEEFLRRHRDDLVETTLDLVAFDTANPPGDAREVVARLESFFWSVRTRPRQMSYPR